MKAKIVKADNVGDQVIIMHNEQVSVWICQDMTTNANIFKTKIDKVNQSD